MKPETQRGWHKEFIKASLRIQGYTLKEVALKLNLDKSTVIHVLGGRRSKRVESFIANVLGEAPETIWPERYTDEASLPR